MSHLAVLEEQSCGSPRLVGCERTTELVFGERKLLAFLPAIGELRLRCGQHDDFTTDAHYFIAANTVKGRRIAAVLIRQNGELEACVLFYEYCKLGVGLGLFRGGDSAGDGLVVGPKAFRVQYVRLAAEALLQNRRTLGVGIAMKASLDHCIQVVGPEGQYRIFCGRSIPQRLPLASTYHGMLASMGPRTRRSLAGKRQQLESRAHVSFLPCLQPVEALEAMLQLQPSSVPARGARFYHARYTLLRKHPELFSMGMRLPDGTWLSILSGWRRGGVTYIDLQMNNLHFKKDSLSAVMRAFMLEHEIARKQESIYFVGGTSVLLRRYCEPTEPSTEVFLQRSCLRARLFQLAAPHLNQESLFRRVCSWPGTYVPV